MSSRRLPPGENSPSSSMAKRLGAWCLRVLALQRSRKHLARLDARLLGDIGLTEAEARAEAARSALEPRWNPPGHWLRQGDCDHAPQAYLDIYMQNP